MAPRFPNTTERGPHGSCDGQHGVSIIVKIVIVNTARRQCCPKLAVNYQTLGNDNVDFHKPDQPSRYRSSYLRTPSR